MENIECNFLTITNSYHFEPIQLVIMFFFYGGRRRILQTAYHVMIHNRLSCSTDGAPELAMVRATSIGGCKNTCFCLLPLARSLTNLYLMCVLRWATDKYFS